MKKIMLDTTLISILLLLVASCTAPGRNDDYGPEIVVDDAVHAFIRGFNGRDLSQFDTYFAPAEQANSDGLLHTQDLAHRFLDNTLPGMTLHLDEWKITNDYPSADQPEAVISYQAKVSLWQKDQKMSTVEVAQDVTLRLMSNSRWQIINAAPPVIDGQAYTPPSGSVSVPFGWETVTTDWYHISYPPNLYKIYETNAAKSLITLVPTAEFLDTALPETVLYRMSVAAQPNYTPAAVDAIYDPADLFGHGPVLEYGSDEIQDATIEKVNLNGYLAYRIDDLSSITADIVALRQDVLYEIVLESYEPGRKAHPEEYMPLAEEMIDTFQFIKPQQ